ncbi:hypothetical protein pb186bvf_001439 [Paramecium bursaria]
MKLFRVLLLMTLLIFGAFAQTLCEQECTAPYNYKRSTDRCCQTRFQGNRCLSGFVDPAGLGDCVV